MGTANVGRSWPVASSTLLIRLPEQGPCLSGEVVLSHGSHWESGSNRGAQGKERVCKTEQAGASAANESRKRLQIHGSKALFAPDQDSQIYAWLPIGEPYGGISELQLRPAPF
jgi:hypothetical protein